MKRNHHDFATKVSRFSLVTNMITYLGCNVTIVITNLRCNVTGIITCPKS